MCYSEGFLSATDDAIVSENCTGTSLAQMSRFWKLQFPKITMANRSLGLAPPNKQTSSLLSLKNPYRRNHWRKHLSLNVWADTSVGKNRATIAKECPQTALSDGFLNTVLQVIACSLCFFHKNVYQSTPTGILVLVPPQQQQNGIFCAAPKPYLPSPISFLAAFATLSIP